MTDEGTDEVSLQLSAPRRLLEELAPRGRQPARSHRLIRADDQLRLRFVLHNGEIDTAANAIVALLGEEPIYYEIWLGSQHRVEAPLGPAEQGSVPRASRVAGESRIVIEVPDRTPFTVATLLDLAAYALVLDERADGAPGRPGQLEPAPEVTAIEVPTGLVLSPTAGARFTAATQPVTRGDITELWQARLVQPIDGADVRAIWSREDDPAWSPPRPVDADTRSHLVSQTTIGRAPAPISVNQLSLSAQGASLDVEGTWAVGALASYRHRAVTGRDLHIEEVARGYLAPFGHRASVTTLTERTLTDDGSGTTAWLTSEEFVTVSADSLPYPAPHMPAAGRGLPFARIAASDPGSGPTESRQVELRNGTSLDPSEVRILTRNGADVHIAYVAEDHAGQGGVSFELPAVFVSESVAYDTGGPGLGVLDSLALWYDEDNNLDFSTSAMRGQAISWAPPVGPATGPAGATHATNRIRWRLERPWSPVKDPTIETELENAARPAFYPRVERAWIVDVTASVAHGSTVPEAEVVVAPRYLEHGLDPEGNVDLGYLDLDSAATPSVIVPTTDATGLLFSGLAIETFGQRLGGAVQVPDGTWSPAQALADLDGQVPTLFGSLTLANLISQVDLSVGGNDGLPALSVEVLPGSGPDSPPSGACVVFNWEPRLKSFPHNAESKTFVSTLDYDMTNASDPLVALLDAFGGRDTHALVNTRTCTTGEQSFEAALERFALRLPPGLPVVAVLFEELRFRDVNGSTSMSTDIADWAFINQLSWLEPVRALLANLIGAAAPSFDDGININSELPVPGLTLGIVGVHGLLVKLGIELPDNGGSLVEYAMSSPQDPFVITVLGFGGTGSFGLLVDAAEIRRIEASAAIIFELAVNVFVVAASISVSLGAYVSYEDQEVTLGAYALIAGSLSFIGLVKITGSVMIGLQYRVNRKLLRGVATLTGEVSSLVGKKSVTRDVAVEIALGSADSARSRERVTARAAPALANGVGQASFGDRFTQSQWTSYCDAFAA